MLKTICTTAAAASEPIPNWIMLLFKKTAIVASMTAHKNRRQNSQMPKILVTVRTRNYFPAWWVPKLIQVTSDASELV